MASKFSTLSCFLKSSSVIGCSIRKLSNEAKRSSKNGGPSVISGKTLTFADILS